MTSESKILTVSYGTFSCTLEGYDDPFDTMKAIAEYFRGLAGDDRYFGAEPPQPDAAMLHRIAEGEVSRIVESRVAAAPSPSQPSDAPAHGPAASGITQHAEVSAEPVLHDVIPSGVAAKLARIRQSAGLTLAPSPVAEAAVDALMTETAFAGPGTVADTDDVLSRIDALTTAPADEMDAPDVPPPSPVEDDRIYADIHADAAPMLEDATAEDLVDDADADALRTDDTLPEDQADSDVTLTVAEAADLLPEMVKDVADDSMSDDVAAPALEPEAHNLADHDAILAGDDLTGFASDDVTIAEAAPSDVSIAEDLPRLAIPSDEDRLHDDNAVIPDDDLPEDLPEISDEPALTGNPVTEYASSFMETEEDTLPEDTAAIAGDDLPEAAAADQTLDDAARIDPLPEDAPAAEPEPAPVAAPVSKFGSKTKRVSSRVVRIHPDEDETPQAGFDSQATRKLDSKDEDFARLLRQADDVMSDDENRRRLDAISHLKAAVAATEADRAAGTEARAHPDQRQDAYRDDLARMAPPESAEPVAEVHPHRTPPAARPQEPRPGTIRPGMISPPPLVLVSEQRIDRIVPPPAPPPAPAAAPAARAYTSPPLPETPPSRPMVALRTGRLTGAIGAAAASPAAPQAKLVLNQPPRSSSAEPDEDEDLDDDLGPIDESGLIRFAEQTGAQSMADLLEAAAAYATCVEGRSQFTRPQLMRRLMACAGGKPISREDGLRSFGTLLRTGRIEKVSRAHYVLSVHSPYLAEARRLG